MDETASAAEANRRFSQLLRGVHTGRRYVVTSHGAAVARLVPATSGDQAAAAARAVLIERLRRQPAVSVPRWTREELYEDDR